ncbi:chlorophyll(ide) b reductase NOL, chloroplastic-like [Corylus avellana]|uniref:chlorophyll(ide) b reductase NOL, chloroplastic-like n=1 Tax=Corylus avellana TaxID=13451 RepID=UPI00286B7B80|nr:chlorophyll(ide) b reductase NOL, chloroplastic-like [Corylus avellana]XP_059448328.1 chlorophyll(ide) b reductase NOL, chloroplastic-like [Corylus avellana]XP_059448329.1 chlorophyll(ide) b reductase NOL, chloroplastic-like [Corylus avellana]
MGSNAYSYKPLAEASDEDLIEVVTTNTLGLMICCREAIKMMLNQHRGGHIFNIDGAGSEGRPTPRYPFSLLQCYSLNQLKKFDCYCLSHAAAYLLQPISLVRQCT